MRRRTIPLKNTSDLPIAGSAGAYGLDSPALQAPITVDNVRFIGHRKKRTTETARKVAGRADRFGGDVGGLLVVLAYCCSDRSC